MKCLLIAAIIFICGSLKPNVPQPCEMVQTYYLNGKVVHSKSFQQVIKDYGCTSEYIIDGKKIIADSVVTTLK